MLDNAVIENMNIEHLNFIMRNLKLFDEFWTESILKSEFENENSVYYVLKANGQIIGFCGLWFNIDEAHIMNIAVLNEKRKNGFGTQMLKYLIKVAEEKNKESITLEVRENNLAAINLYSKLEFVELGRRKKYYDGVDDAIIMTKYLVH